MYKPVGAMVNFFFLCFFYGLIAFVFNSIEIHCEKKKLYAFRDRMNAMNIILCEVCILKTENKCKNE